MNRLRVASLFLVFVMLIPMVVSAADLPLETVKTGTITGGLSTGVAGVWPENDATVEFTLPSHDRIEWAGLFTLVYGGNMEDNRSGWANTTLNGELIGSELLTIDAPDRGQVYHLNENVNRVTSDYQVWYDVTDHIDGEAVTARVVSEKVDPDWDGRIRYIALVVAYIDDDGDEVTYWVNPGHAVTAESYNPDPRMTSFTTHSLGEAPEAAYLSVVSTSGTDGSYHLNGAELPRGGGLEDGVRVNRWNVASHIEPGVDSELSAEWESPWGYKWTLATLVTEPGPVFDISSVVFNPEANAGHRELFAHQPNVIEVEINNTGSRDAEYITIRLEVSDYNEEVYNEEVVLPVIESGESAIATFPDYIPDRAGEVDLSITVGDDLPHEETAIVYYNGYKGKRWTDGEDLRTVATYTGSVNVSYSTGDAEYSGNGWAEKTVTWVSDDLPVPEGAEILNARLLQGYTWNRMEVDPSPTMTFNDGIITADTSYTDRKGYGGWDFPGGLLAYDVTDLYSSTGNSLMITPEEGADYAIYGSSLIVVYEDASEVQRTIRINEGYDIIQSHPGYCTNDEEATAYALFEDITNENLQAGKAVAIVQGRPVEAKSAFLFNGEEYEGFWEAYLANEKPQVGFSVYDVTSAIEQGENEAGIRSVRDGASGDSLQAVGVILVTEYTSGEEDPIGVFRGGTWYIRDEVDPRGYRDFGFGMGTDIPVVVDGAIGVFRDGTWYIEDEVDPRGYRDFGFGMGTDIPVVVDGAIGVFRDGTWYIEDEVDPRGYRDFSFGIGTDIPVVVDGAIGVFRDGTWYIEDEIDPRGYRDFSFGMGTDIPVVVDGAIGVFRDGTWYIEDEVDPRGYRDYIFGTAGDVPVVV